MARRVKPARSDSRAMNRHWLTDRPGSPMAASRCPSASARRSRDKARRPLRLVETKELSGPAASLSTFPSSSHRRASASASARIGANIRLVRAPSTGISSSRMSDPPWRLAQSPMTGSVSVSARGQSERIVSATTALLWPGSPGKRSPARSNWSRRCLPGRAATDLASSSRSLGDRSVSPMSRSAASSWPGPSPTARPQSRRRPSERSLGSSRRSMSSRPSTSWLRSSSGRSERAKRAVRVAEARSRAARCWRTSRWSRPMSSGCSCSSARSCRAARSTRPRTTADST